MRRSLLALCALAAALLVSGCGSDAACGSGGCGPSPNIGVSPYEGRYIEGGHGWR